MNRRWFTPLTHLLPIIVAFSFVYITSLSLIVAFPHTETHHHGAPHACPFMAHITSWCPMIVTEHLDMWHQMTTLLIPSLLFAYLAFFVTHQTYGRYSDDNRFKPSNNTLTTQKIYQWILHLFSIGILHTKIP